MPIHRLTQDLRFPRPDQAERSGVLAVGGDLSVERLLLAYSSGIFPWYSDGEPLIWWSPDPRFVLFPERLIIHDSMKRIMKTGRFSVTLDRDFASVIDNCRRVRRRGQDGTWITSEMVEAYCRLHEAGYAHSVEVWLDAELAGGLYGVSLGGCFFGESMFTRVSNAGKAGLITLVEWMKAHDFKLIDCQVCTPHLRRLGAVEIPRREFLGLLEDALARESIVGRWEHQL